jgi:hypothetical protein
VAPAAPPQANPSGEGQQEHKVAAGTASCVCGDSVLQLCSYNSRVLLGWNLGGSVRISCNLGKKPFTVMCWQQLTLAADCVWLSVLHGTAMLYLIAGSFINL